MSTQTMTDEEWAIEFVGEYHLRFLGTGSLDFAAHVEAKLREMGLFYQYARFLSQEVALADVGIWGWNDAYFIATATAAQRLAAARKTIEATAQPAEPVPSPESAGSSPGQTGPQTPGGTPGQPGPAAPDPAR